jgi:hypothetical protein
MENNTNNVTFDVTGHTKIWHKEAGKVYDDSRGELVTDEKNTIRTILKEDLAFALVALNTGKYMGSGGYVTGISDANLNLNLVGGGAGAINGKSSICIGNAAIGAASNVIHCMNTSVAGSGVSRTFTGVFTKSTVGSQAYLSAALVQVTTPSIANPTPLEAIAGAVLATQTTPAFSRTLNQNDTLTIDWTITIN